MSGPVTPPLQNRRAVASVRDADPGFCVPQPASPSVSDRLRLTASPPDRSTAGALP